MKKMRLADYDHSLVCETALALTDTVGSEQEKIEKLFYYVRDDIKFGFPPKGDLMKASDTIKLGIGQCNTKTTLLLALCKAIDIPARMHFSLIKKQIQQGLFTGILYKIMPPLLSHSWIEIKISGSWKRIDSYINDLQFYQKGKEELRKRGMDTGYSISCSSGSSSADFNISEEKFVQMDAVVEDHGIWDEPSQYYESENYKNRPGIVKMVVYRLMISKINKKISQIRDQCRSGLCGISR